MSLTVRRMKSQDAPDVALLHSGQIDFGFISTLGGRFLRLLYSAMLRSGLACIQVAEADGRVVGFVAGTPAVKRLFSRVLRKHWWRFGLILLPKALSPRVVRYCWETLRYPTRHEIEGLPEAELLSIAVAPSYAGQGIGKQLVERLLTDLRACGADAVRVAVLATTDANKFYQRVGFTLRGQVPSHGRALNVYVAETSPEGKRQ